MERAKVLLVVQAKKREIKEQNGIHSCTLLIHAQKNNYKIHVVLSSELTLLLIHDNGTPARISETLLR